MEPQIHGYRAFVDITRLARSTDAGAIAQVQLKSWHERIPSALQNLTLSEIADAWEQAIVTENSHMGRVLVVERMGIVEGFCAITFETGTPDTGSFESGRKKCELVALEVTPAQRRSTLGIRLTNAAADLARSSGMSEIDAWLGTQEIPAQHLLLSAGWVASGRERTVAIEPSDGNDAVDRVEWHYTTALIDS